MVYVKKKREKKENIDVQHELKEQDPVAELQTKILKRNQEISQLKTQKQKLESLNIQYKEWVKRLEEEKEELMSVHE